MQQRLSPCSILTSECVWKPSFTYLVGNIDILLKVNYTIYIYMGRHSLQLGFPVKTVFPCKLALGNMLRNDSHSSYMSHSPWCLMQQCLSPCSILRSECVWKPSFTYLVGNTEFLLKGNYATYISLDRHSLILGFPMQVAFPCKADLGKMLEDHSQCF